MSEPSVQLPPAEAPADLEPAATSYDMKVRDIRKNPYYDSFKPQQGAEPGHLDLLLILLLVTLVLSLMGRTNLLPFKNTRRS
jgi:hypothetical protein